MTGRGSWLRGLGDAIPVDLAGVLALVVLTDLAALVAPLRGSPVQALPGLALALFVPGYAILAAVVPADPGRVEDGDVSDPPGADDRDGRVDRERSLAAVTPVERVAYAVGLSAVVSIVVAFVASATVGTTTVGILGGLSTVTLVATAVAVVRDHRSPLPGGRGSDGTSTTSGTVGDDPGSTRNRRVVTAAIVVVLVGSVAVSGYLVAGPKPHQGYTEVYVLGEDTAGPDATDYPRNFTAGNPRTLVVGVENHHPDRREYTAVVVAQRLGLARANGSRPGGNATGNGSAPVVLAERELARLQPGVDPDERWTRDVAVAPELTGRVRLVVRLYPGGEATGDPLHELHLWIDVAPPDGEGTVGSGEGVDGA